MSDRVRKAGSTILVILCIAVASAVWYLNPVSQQYQIGLLLGVELIGFSMIIYLYTRPSDEYISELWLIVGTITIAFLLGMATL